LWVKVLKVSCKLSGITNSIPPHTTENRCKSYVTTFFYFAGHAQADIKVVFFPVNATLVIQTMKL